MVQLSEELVAELDAVARRDGQSRSAVIREAVVAHLAAERQRDAGRLIVAGYERIPAGEPDA